jgi:anaerobic magnesium-protoporphyrin IX monomethyl ester cyclase
LKVLLISNPSSHNQKQDFPPLGIASLGAIARKAGHEVQLIDGGASTLPEIVRHACRFNPAIIGVTCWTIGRGMVWKLCNELKERIPSVFLVLGGPHASLYPMHVFVKTTAEAVVVGEGEQTFQELLTAMERNQSLRGIPGLMLRDTDNEMNGFQKRELIENIDSLPLPFYEGFDHFSFSRYAGFPLLPRPTAAIISSRGCVYNCAYCGSTAFWGRQWRYRSAANILNEIEWLRETYHIRSIYFFDDNFTVNHQRVSTICNELINRNWNLPWSCCSHVKTVNRELLALMKESGCVSIDFGVESGSNHILTAIRKQQTAGDIERTFSMVHAAGIKPRAYLMVGNPGENESTIDETIGMINRIRPHSSIGATILWLLPGTTIYADAVEDGYIDDDYWLINSDIPYNLQEYSYPQLYDLRKRLMYGIAKGKATKTALINYYLKSIYYRFPELGMFRHLIPRALK